jgi:chitin synthase
MYRIKSPKGGSGYWVPILANPDIVEHYSENVVDTLHKKNLLLLGEDRYLTTLMLKTFPKRKMIFCPQAVCKTVVPDTFRVLLSQRRRWINSTIHNLAELLLVRDLCGTFCFSMQFVVFMELAGTLVLPAAISFTIYLIVISAVNGGSSTTIPLVLLGIILGLPGLLIVVTSRKIAYIGWMFVYLLSLPIWNFVLPTYAFWHFDDFSWGQTRRVSGDKGGNHGDKEGEFDSSHIVMKRWAEFERERRWRGGTQSRDSTYYDTKSNSPKRYSMVSTAEHDSNDSLNYAASQQQQRQRLDSTPVLMLPAPLSVNNNGGVSARQSEDHTSTSTYVHESGSRSRLIPSPPTTEYSSQQYDGYSSHGMTSPEVYSPSPLSIESYVNRAGVGANGSSAVLRQPTVSSQIPNETRNPFYHQNQVQAQSAAGYNDDDFGRSTESDDTQSSGQGPMPPRAPSRGVTLSDNGPVPGPEGVRRVARPSSRRPSSQQPPTNRYSRTSMYGSPSNAPLPTLPPGAAPPRPYGDM